MNNLARLKKIFFVLIPFLSIGCLNYIQDVYLYGDGSGVMKISFWMKSLGNDNSVIVEKIGLFNSDSLRSAFQSPYNTIEDIEVYTDSTDSTMHAIIELTFPSIDSLNNHKCWSPCCLPRQRWPFCCGLVRSSPSASITGFGVNR